MPTYEIPLISEPQEFSVALGGKNYTLRVTWNEVSQSWNLDILDSQGVLMVGSIAMVTGVDLLEVYAYLEFGGSMIAETQGDVLIPPSRTNLGQSGKLYFITS